MFELASDLEKACIGLTMVKDLLSILIDDVFNTKGEISKYIEQYETLAVMALTTLDEKEKAARRISNMLYEIDRRASEMAARD